MLKGASLLYAVFLCAIIATLCGVLLFVFSISKLSADKQLITGNFVINSQLCFDRFLADKSLGFNTSYVNTDFDYCTCEIESRSWGLISLLKQKTYFGNDTLSKNIFAGVTYSNPVAFYKANLGKQLKVSGETNILGDIVLPNGRVERATIKGNQSINNPKLIGTITSSGPKLPAIVNTNFILPAEKTEVAINDLKSSGGVFNSFNKPTLVVYVDDNESLGNIFLRGNIVLVSKSSIEISRESQLEDVIIVSPNVKINKGFEGAIQVYASNTIFIEESVVLNYPSCLILNSLNTTTASILEVSSKSKIYGNLILNSINNANNNDFVKIADKTSIYGTIYCKGTLEFKGEVKGSVFTQNINYKTAYSEYTDVLIDAKIDAVTLSHNFVGIPIFKENNSEVFGIIKEL